MFRQLKTTMSNFAQLTLRHLHRGLSLLFHGSTRELLTASLTVCVGQNFAMTEMAFCCEKPHSSISNSFRLTKILLFSGASFAEV